MCAGHLGSRAFPPAGVVLRPRHGVTAEQIAEPPRPPARFGRWVRSACPYRTRWPVRGRRSGGPSVPAIRCRITSWGDWPTLAPALPLYMASRTTEAAGPSFSLLGEKAPSENSGASPPPGPVLQPPEDTPPRKKLRVPAPPSQGGPPGPAGSPAGPTSFRVPNQGLVGRDSLPEDPRDPDLPRGLPPTPSGPERREGSGPTGIGQLPLS